MVSRLRDHKLIQLRWIKLFGGGLSWNYLIDEEYYIYEVRHDNDF